MAYASVLSVIGWLLSAWAVLMALPIPVALLNGEAHALAGLSVAALLTLFLGGAMVFATRGGRRKGSKRESILLAVLVWLVLPAFGALPLLISGATESVLDAYFELVSAFTTTGATLWNDVSAMPRSLVLWRSLAGWAGGLATIVLALALLATFGIGGMQFLRSHVPHSEHDALDARLLHAVSAIWWVYLLLTAVCALLLWIVGLSGFDALAYAMGAVSTTGFETTEEGLAQIGGPSALAVMAPFMFLGALSFGILWSACRGQFRPWGEDREFRYVTVIALVAAIMIAAGLVRGGDDFLSAAGHGAFLAISVISTTGISPGQSVAGYLGVAAIPVLVLALTLVGGATGSTAGGLKVMRLALLVKEGGRELMRLAHPHGIAVLKYGGRSFPDAELVAVWAFISTFVVCAVLIALALGAAGLDLQSALAMATAAIANAGPSATLIGGAEASYLMLDSGGKFVVMAAMLLGRLEILAVVVLFSAAMWRD